MDIEIKISKNEIVRTTIIEPVKEPTMSALLTSLKSVKQQSNDTMTNFVNSEKTLGSLNCTSKRKDDDDDDEDESESKWNCEFYKGENSLVTEHLLVRLCILAGHTEDETDDDRSIKKLRSDDESVEQSC